MSQFNCRFKYIYIYLKLYFNIYIYIYIYIYIKYSFKCKLLFVIKLTFLSQSVIIEAVSFYMSILKAIYFVEMVKSRYTYTTVHCFDFFTLHSYNGKLYIINPATSKGGSNGPSIGFLDLKFEAFKQSK